MQCAFKLNEKGEITAGDQPCLDLLGEQSIGKRLDRFVDWKSGPGFLSSLLDAYAGNKIRRAAVTIIQSAGRPIHAHMSLEAETEGKDGEKVSLKGKIYTK